VACHRDHFSDQFEASSSRNFDLSLQIISVISVFLWFQSGLLVFRDRRNPLICLKVRGASN